MKYFDKQNNRLVFESSKASAEFWDAHWNIADFKDAVLSGKNDRFVSRYTKKYISPDKSKKILEGGCGKGNLVFSLNFNGYDAYGVDYATNTVTKINNLFPELKITEGDVQKLDFSDDFFDGYWSLGVIEHFYDGYDKITKEMERVIKKGGFLFITVPYLSPFRKLKNKLNQYPLFDENSFNKERFYQFALDYKKVRDDLEKIGFKMIYKKSFDGMKGLKDEILPFKSFLQKIYSNKHIVCRIISFGISKLSSFFAGHSILLIFKKNA
jgi:ubiquinone/menaquinone biosynthesis C-methylase UbiE